MEHPLGWDGNSKFPARKVNNPPVDVTGLWAGVCVVCGGSLGGPYQEDLIHFECETVIARTPFVKQLDK